MKKLLSLIVLMMCFANLSYAVQNVDFVRAVRNGKAIHTGNSCIGGDVAKVLSNNTTGSITVDTTPEGRKSAEINIVLDTYADAAIGTMNALSGTVEGDIIYLHSLLASQDIVVLESTTIHMESSSYKLSDPKDVLKLLNIDGTNLVDIGFYDNN